MAAVVVRRRLVAARLRHMLGRRYSSAARARLRAGRLLRLRRSRRGFRRRRRRARARSAGHHRRALRGSLTALMGSARGPPPRQLRPEVLRGLARHHRADVAAPFRWSCPCRPTPRARPARRRSSTARRGRARRSPRGAGTEVLQPHALARQREPPATSDQAGRAGRCTSRKARPGATRCRWTHVPARGRRRATFGVPRAVDEAHQFGASDIVGRCIRRCPGATATASVAEGRRHRADVEVPVGRPGRSRSPRRGKRTGAASVASEATVLGAHRRRGWPSSRPCSTCRRASLRRRRCGPRGEPRARGSRRTPVPKVRWSSAEWRAQRIM